MTKPDPYDPLADALPGLGVDPQIRTGLMTEAVRETLRTLAERGLLRPEHSAMAQLALQLAQAIEAASLTRRASAVAIAARELREVLEALPQIEDTGGVPSVWEDFERQYRQAT